MSEPPKAVGFSDALARAKEVASRLAASRAAAGATGSPQADSFSEAGKRLASGDDSGSGAKRHAGLGYSGSGDDYGGGGGSGYAEAIARSAHDPVVMHEISVPSPNVGLIIGKSGETIRRLESETFVKVQVTPDNGEPDRRVVLTGTRSQIDKAVQLIEDILQRRVTSTQIVNSLSSGTPLPVGAANTEHYLIPNGKVGLIIGRGGDMIRELERKSGSVVQVAPDNSTLVNNKRVVIITGDDQQRTRAKFFIDELVQEDVVKEFHIPRDPNTEILQRAGFGAAAKAIKAAGPTEYLDLSGSNTSGGDLYENPERRRAREERGGPDGGGFDHGQQQQQQQQQQQPADAQDFFARELASFKTDDSQSLVAPPSSSTYGFASKSSGANANRLEIQVPNSAVGLIIGRGGENIKKLEAQYGVKFVIPNESLGQQVRTAFLVGNREGALEVEKQINEIIAQSNMRLQQQQQQAPGVPGMPRIFQNPNKQVRIPATHTGLIIGRGGEMIKLFERSTGARVAVDQTGVGPERIVNIVGTPEQCDAVEIMVWEKIAEAENRQSRYGGGGGGAKYSSSASSASSYGSQSQGGYAEQYAQMYSQYAAAAAYSQYAYDPNALAAAAAAGGDATAQAAAAGATADPAAAAATAGGAPGGPGTNGTYDGNFFYAADYPGWRYNYTTNAWEPIPAGEGPKQA